MAVSNTVLPGDAASEARRLLDQAYCAAACDELEIDPRRLVKGLAGVLVVEAASSGEQARCRLLKSRWAAFGVIVGTRAVACRAAGPPTINDPATFRRTWLDLHAVRQEHGDLRAACLSAGVDHDVTLAAIRALCVESEEAPDDLAGDVAEHFLLGLMIALRAGLVSG